MKRAFAIVLCLVALGACTRGGKKKVEPTGASADPSERPANASAPTNGAGASAWARGDLPPLDPSQSPVSGGQVVVGIGSEPPSLNGHVDSDWVGSKVSGQVYETLVTPDPYDEPAYKMKPALAERWHISDDKLTYTFFLRRGVRWHDGKAFTADDVIATLDKVTDETTRAAHVRSYLEELERYEKVDDFTVRFHWKRPYFQSMDAVGDLAIQPAHVISKLTGTQYNEAATNSLNRHPIGTGPFKFVVWESNQKIVLARNERYWGRKAYLDRVVFRIVQDPTVSKQLALRGDLDFWNRVSDEQWANMDGAKLARRFNRSLVYASGYAWIGWNQKAKPFFADKRVRRAMTLLLDRKRISETMYYGLRKPTACTFYWASSACDGVEPLPYDTAQAERLLDEAGWVDSDKDGVRDKEGVPFEFTFMIPASSVSSAKLGTKMKEDFRRYGIEVVLQKVEWTAFTKRLRKHEFDACTLQWGGGPRPEDPSQIWHSKSQAGGSNYVGFSHAKADRLMEEARVVFDAEKRNALYREFGKILADEQPYTILFVSPQLSLINKRVRGVQESLLWWQFGDLWVEQAAK